MADAICIHCDDLGDCPRCSPFYEPTKVHAKCGFPWGEHEVAGNSAPFGPVAVCPVPAQEVAKVYEHVTGGVLSSPTYTASAVIGAADAHFDRCFDAFVIDHDAALTAALRVLWESFGREPGDFDDYVADHGITDVLIHDLAVTVRRMRDNLDRLDDEPESIQSLVNKIAAAVDAKAMESIRIERCEFDHPHPSHPCGKRVDHA